MAIASLLAILLQIRYQSNVDIFFLDWEQQIEYKDEEDLNRGISIWRTLFVANEFNELNVLRKISLEWTLMILAFFLTGLSWVNAAAETPSLTTSTNNIASNYVLRYFISSFVFFVIGLAQILLQKFLTIWYATHMQDFIDLCSVANISIFVLDQHLHGFYLHGKNPSATAEGNA
jgi:meckelin